MLGGETRSQAGPANQLMLASDHEAAMHRAGKVCFELAFLRKHPSVAKCFRKAIQQRGSRWKEVEASGRGVHCIGSLDDCQAVLRRVRRLKAVAGVHASFLRPGSASSKLPAASTL